MSDETPRINLIIANPELRKQLQELVITDFEKFLQKAPVDDLQIFICAELVKGRSHQGIKNALARHGISVPRSTVGDRCKKCPDDPGKK